jgi:neutral ceramidase
MQAGAARRDLTPPWGVELAGLGYFLNRAWQRIRDPLAATALVLDDGATAAALIAVDLMYLDAAFVADVRERIARETGIPGDHVLIGASHSHNAPNAAVVRGVGERDDHYVEWAARQASTAAIVAWRERREVRLRAGHVDLLGATYNRTRENGPVDPALTVLRADAPDGTPVAVAVNFASHSTAMMEWDRFAVSRDYPGTLTDTIEACIPGCTALFLQGSCGDVNFRPEFSRDGYWHEAGRLAAGTGLQAVGNARPLADAPLEVRRVPVSLPSARYDRAEVEREREAALRFAGPTSTEGWREILGSVMVGRPDRFPDRYGNDERKAVDALVRFTLGWTEEILKDLETRDPLVPTEAWGLRIGDFALAANGAELFTHWALDLRERAGAGELMVVGYANDGLSYVADEHDIERRTYAAWQSPKYMGRFPFTVESGQALTDAMLKAISR